jgi:hypothetical protein
LRSFRTTESLRLSRTSAKPSELCMLYTVRSTARDASRPPQIRERRFTVYPIRHE